MGSWDQCIDAALSNGKITKQLANQIREADDPLALVNEMTETAKRNKREAAIDAVRIADAWERIQGHEKGAEAGLMSLMVKDATGKAGYANIDMRQKYWENLYHSMVPEFLNRFKSKVSGLRILYDEAGIEKFVRAMYGESIDDADIAGMAKSYAEVLKRSRADFNRMGGSIADNERYIMPQNHDAATITKYGKDEWLGDIANWVDRDAMTDDFGRRLNDDDLQAGLDYAFDSITTHGLNKAKDFTAPVGQGKKMARKGSERRFLYFKDAESWLAYHNKYGRGDVFQTLTSHINYMANDIATMEIAGTNPRAWFDTLMVMVEKDRVAQGKKMAGAWGQRKNMLEAVFKVTTGAVERGNLTTLADFGQAVRNTITASKLGKAMLSALSDEGFTGPSGDPEPHARTRLPEAEGRQRRRLHLHPAVLRQPRLLRLPRAL